MDNSIQKPNLFSSLAHFLIGSFIFLELSCRSCLYIFEISCLSVTSFAIILSHSEGCLFTLLIVSFVVQKLLSLIRSHLFIFAFISNILEGGSCLAKTSYQSIVLSTSLHFFIFFSRIEKENFRCAERQTQKYSGLVRFHFRSQTLDN